MTARTTPRPRVPSRARIAVELAALNAAALLLAAAAITFGP